jgi:hypothetical protein
VLVRLVSELGPLVGVGSAGVPHPVEVSDDFTGVDSCVPVSELIASTSISI